MIKTHIIIVPVHILFPKLCTWPDTNQASCHYCRSLLEFTHRRVSQPAYCQWYGIGLAVPHVSGIVVADGVMPVWMVAVLQQTLILRHGDGCLMPFSCLVLLDNWQILVRGNTPMGGCLQRPLRRHAREPTLKWGKRVGLCYGSRQLIPLGYFRNTVEFQSGDDFRVALGRSSLSGLETPLGVLFDFLMSTVSVGMLTAPCNILYNRIIRWSRRRSANGRHFRSFRSCVTLTDPYWPHAQRAAPGSGLPLYLFDGVRVLVENGVPNAGIIFQLRPVALWFQTF